MKTRHAVLTAFTISLFACTDPINDANTIMVIDRHTTADSLAAMIAELGRQNIALEVQDAKYNDNGQLKSISGTVTVENGATATFTSERVNKIFLQYDHGGRNGLGVVVKEKWF
jgi:hypothetical protein